jgi:transcriptional regulator EpsA
MNASTGLAMIDRYSRSQAESLVQIIESATEVRRRSHFFLWSQSVLQSFLPHQVALCAAYNRQVKELEFDAFYSVPVPAPLLGMFVDARSPLLRQIVLEWIGRRGRCTTIDMKALSQHVGSNLISDLVNADLGELLVHGVARPHRPTEVETLFVLAAPRGQLWAAEHQTFFELMLPHIHSTYLRVQVNERELSAVQPRARAPLATSPITSRESEILLWVRDGMSNQQIGEQLAISALTVKNHLQRILRKLGAANRAQAVAMAISMNLISSDRSPDGH